MSLQIPPESSTPAHSQQQQRNYPQSAGPSYHTQRPTSLAAPQYSSSNHSHSRAGGGGVDVGGGHTYNAMPMPPTQSPPGPPSASRRQQQRATVALSPNQRDHQQSQPATAHPNSNQSGGNQNAAAPSQVPIPDVYAHPAALAYAAAHPRRTIPKFGPYLLLQTLGEGEFGKVKLGLHSQWGEEVAVKLIRRGNVDSTVRMSKIEREIEVLKTLKHPNIVRLYDVIETDKYIGIILEYASGGELFDHILAHRYLREKDAAKLFSQLISGVWYIHQKKIVHRDLKLENLLLDRNRNVIITDFGFANRFEHKSDDLMQTSCGSPCYAAPELVISEGLYVGSAVDIWSCGVILYAMLAGYLPFDDDPANPDGDNINLLYKYIVSTPLSFPDYISVEARDLLSMMLVPDPTRRTTLDGVMRHTWLKPYWGTLRTDGQPNAFGKTVEDLEKHAMEQHQLKRVAYQRQMRQQAQAAQAGGSGAQQAGGSGNANVAPTPSRAQSHRPEARSERSAPSNAVPPIVTTAVAGQTSITVPTPTRSRSTQPEYLYESSPSSPVTGVVSDPSVSLLTSPPPSVVSKPASNKPQPATPQNKESPGQKKFASPAALGLSEDDPFAVGVGSAASASASNTASNTLSPPSQSPGDKGDKEKKGHGAFRHTIQVEYDSEPKERGRRQPSGGRPKESTSPRKEKEEHKQNATDEKAVPDLPPAAAAVLVPPTAYRAPAAPNASAPAPAPISVPPVQIPATTAPAVPATPESAVSAGADSNTSSVGKAQGTGHKKGKSSIDRIGLGKIFGGKDTGANAKEGTGSPSISATPSTVSGVSQPDSTMDTTNDGEKREKTKEERKREEKEEREREKERKKGTSGRRNTLTVMVEPLSRSIRNRSQNQKTPISSVYPEGSTTAVPATAKNANASLQPPPMPTSMPFPPGAARSTSTTSNTSASLLNSAVPSSASSSAANSATFSPPSQDFGDVPMTASERAGMQASTSKAKKVMQWFRSKSKGRESLAPSYPVTPNTEDSDVDKDSTPTQTQTSQTQTPIANRYRRGYSASSSTVNQTGEKDGKEQQSVVAPPVQVVVTTPTSSVSRPAPPTPVRSETAAPAVPTTATTPVTSSFVSRFRNSVTVGGRDRERQRQMSTSSNKLGAFYGFNSSSSSQAQQQQQQQQNAVPPHPYAQLRIHHGAVDQTTITTRPPPEVMAHVRKVLESMGVEAQMESEYKVRCVRVKKRKDAVIGPSGSAAEGHEEGKPPGLAVITMMGSAASNGVDKRGLPLPSPSGTFSASTGGMLRGLLMRRQSSQVASGVPPTSSHGPSGTLAFDDEHSVVVGEPLPSTGRLVASSSVDPITPVISPGQGAFPFTTASGSGVVGPAYGDPSQDAGDEVRFSVELTRLDRLNDTYSLDIRRLKGNLRSYKFLYDTLRQRADLSAARA